MTESHRDELAKLEALFSANPDGRIFTHLAEAYRKVGELERARETVEQGLRRYDDYASAHVVHGRVLNDLGDVAGAEQAFRRVLELDPQNREALRTLGDLAHRDGRAEEALSHYRNLLFLDPGNAEVEELVKRVEAEVPVAPPEDDAGEWNEVVLDEEPWDPADAGELETTGSLVEPGELVDTPFEPMDLDASPEAGEIPEYDMSWEADSMVEDGVAEGAGQLLDFEPTLAEDAGFDAVEGLEGLEGGFEDAGGEELDFDSLDLVAPEVAAASVTADLIALDRERQEQGATEAAEDEYGTTANDAVASALGSLLGDDVGDVELEEGDGPVVLTETMAELYAKQGLHDQAAAVYRELLRERPDDERLRARLEALEGEAGSSAADEAFGFDEMDLSGFDAGEPHDEAFATSGEGAMDLGVGGEEDFASEGGDDELVLGSANVFEDDLGDEDNLAGAWISDGEDAVIGPFETDRPEPEAAGADSIEGDPLPVMELPGAEDVASDDAGEEEPWAAAPEQVAGEDDGELLLDASEIVDGEIPADASLEADALDLSEADILVDAEPVEGLTSPGDVIEPDTPWAAEAAAPAPAGRTIGAYLRELVNFRVGDAHDGGMGTDPSDEAELLLDASDVVTSDDVDEFDLLFGGGSTAEPEPEVPPAPAAPAAEEDEEDLEMFRAWLQNLKR